MKSRLSVLLVVVATFLFVPVGFFHRIDVYDEGVQVYGAARILAGEVPYRDFWTLYAPGQFYLLATLFRIFSPSLVVERTASVLIIAAGALVVYALSVVMASRSLALLPWALWTLTLGSFIFFGSAVPTALLIAAASWFAVLQFLASGRLTWLALSGGLVGVTALVRHDFGAYTFLVVTGLLAISAGARLRRLLTFGGATLLPLAVALVALLYAGTPAKTLLADLVLFPLSTFAEARALPAPNPLSGLHGPVALAEVFAGLRFYFPLGILAITGITVVALWRQRALDRAELRRVALFAGLVLLFLNNARIRSDVVHALPAWCPALVLFAWLASKARNRLLKGLIAGTALTFGLPPLLTKLTFAAYMVSFAATGTSEFTYTIPRARGIADAPAQQAYEAGVEYIRTVVPPDARIFVGNLHHDRVATGDALFYFLAERHSATRYHEIHPGLTTTAAVQEVMVSELERAGVTYVVIRLRDPALKDDDGQPHGGVEILDRYIQTRFEPVVGFGTYLIAKRK
ncbi:MAG: hypothetical protein Q7W02_28440 [Candidatus Rokubacteria bacterium]|nr:hypothetical protein [Candidatus Rokubacteria bacterium]